MRPDYVRQVLTGERRSGFEGILAARQESVGAILGEGDAAAGQPAGEWDWAEVGPRFAAFLVAARDRRA